VFDNFYMCWQRRFSVFNGAFACCRLGHTIKKEDGTERCLPCDKARIRPLVEGMWARKVAHLSIAHPMVKFLFMWRWASHAHMMQAKVPEDCEENDDPSLCTRDDIIRKYSMDETILGLQQMFAGQMLPAMTSEHASFKAGAHESSDQTGEQLWEMARGWYEKWGKMSPDEILNPMAMSFMVAEGNLAMVKLLHEEHGASLDEGYAWGITLLDFAAGKGHARIIEYLIAKGLKHDINRHSFRERIRAIDRAAKAGFADCVELLHRHGGDIDCKRLNGQTPAHGAAMFGHTDVLRALQRLGADLSVKDEEGNTPAFYAKYYHQMAAIDFLDNI
jgi:hypothetical protein